MVTVVGRDVFPRGIESGDESRASRIHVECTCTSFQSEATVQGGSSRGRDVLGSIGCYYKKVDVARFATGALECTSRGAFGEIDSGLVGGAVSPLMDPKRSGNERIDVFSEQFGKLGVGDDALGNVA